MNLTREAFEKSELFRLLNEWVEQRIVSEYAVPGHYLGETEQWIEYEFDEEGFRKAKQSCYDAAWALYKPFEETHIFSNEDIETYFCVPYSHCAAILGITFAIISEDYQNIKPVMGNRYLVFRKYEECITKYFLEFDYIDDWLVLYAMLHPFVLRNKLPKLFKCQRAKEVLNAFRYAGYLDSEYKPVKAKVGSNLVAAALLDVIHTKIIGIGENMPWKEVGEYWGIKNFASYYTRGNGSRAKPDERNKYMRHYDLFDEVIA